MVQINHFRGHVKARPRKPMVAIRDYTGVNSFLGAVDPDFDKTDDFEGYVVDRLRERGAL